MNRDEFVEFDADGVLVFVHQGVLDEANPSSEIQFYFGMKGDCLVRLTS